MMKKKHLIVILALTAVFLAMGGEGLYAGLAALPLLGAALTVDRDTPQRSGDSIVLGVAAAKKIYAGALVARDASGYATPGAVATTLIGAGCAAEQADNSAGAAAAITVTVQKGVFRFANSTAGDLITTADIGNDCYIVDDQTVAKTNGTGTRSVAGKIYDVDSIGVWVRFL